MSEEIRVPSDSSLEEGLLGLSLSLPGVATELAGVLESQDWHDSGHRRIFEAQVRLILSSAEPTDIRLVHREAVTAGMTPEEARAIIARSLERRGSRVNLSRYIEDIKRLGWRRKVLQMATKAARKVSERGSDDEDIRAELIRVALGEGSGPAGGALVTAREAAGKFQPCGPKCEIPTGISTLDHYLPTISMPGLLTVVAAGTSIGKSALLRQMALAASESHEVLYCPLEEGTEQVATQMIYTLADLNYWSHYIWHEPMSQSERLRLSDAQDRFSRRRLQLFDPDEKTAQRVATCMLHLSRSGRAPRMLLIDHLHQFLFPSWGKELDQARAIGESVHTIQTMARRTRIPVVLGAQIRRDPRQHKRVPTISDIRNSGEVENRADQVLVIHAERWDPQTAERILLCYKNRYGPTFKMNLHFKAETQTFHAIERRMEEPDHVGSMGESADLGI